MVITKKSATAITVVFIIVDIGLSTLFLIWNDGMFLSHMPWVYDFRTSQLDHCALALLRLAILIGCLIGVCYNSKTGVERAKATALFVVCVCLGMAVYSPTKLLALAETTNDFRLPWFWSLFAWNIVASIICAVLWSFLLCNVTTSGGNVVKVEADGHVVDDDTERLIDNELFGNGTDNHHSAESVVGHDTSTSDKKENSGFRVKDTTSQIWRLISYARREWIPYTIAFIFLMLYSATRIFIPYYTGRVLSDIVVQHSYDRLLRSLLIMANLAVASAVTAGLRGGFFQYAFGKFSVRIRVDLFSSLVKQEIGFFDVTKTGDITSRLSADCQTVSDSISLNFNVFLRSTIMLIGTLVFMFQLSWHLTIMTFIALPVLGIITKIYGKYYEKLSQEGQDALASANTVAEEVLSSMRTVRSFANEPGENARYGSKMADVLNIRKKQAYAYVGYMGINELFDLLLLVAVLWYGGHLVLDNRLKAEDFIAYLMYQMQLGDSLQMIGYVITGLMQAVGAAKKVFEWMERQPEIPNNGKETLDDVKGRVEFKDVCFSYPSRPEVEVLKNVSFSAKPGEVVALVGPSGGGKSSCIALLEHFYEPKSGVISLDGVPVQSLDHAFFHRKVSLVGQEPVLFACSIGENISYGLDSGDYSEETVTHAAKLANAHDFVKALPTGYKTDVGEKGLQMSGGQKQRIAIARALIRNPKVLLLDEATSALDAESEYLVKQAIHQNLAGHTVLLIAHRLSTVEKADKIVVIDGGRVVQQGTHAQLLVENGLYKNLVHRQLLGDRAPDEDSIRHESKNSGGASQPMATPVVEDSVLPPRFTPGSPALSTSPV